MSFGLQALSGFANSNPLVRVAVKYWWLALPAGYAMWSLSKERQKVTTATAIQDFATTFGPILSVIMLAEMLDQRSHQAPSTASAPPLASPAPVKDAEFRLQSTVKAPLPFPKV